MSHSVIKKIVKSYRYLFLFLIYTVLKIINIYIIYIFNMVNTLIYLYNIKPYVHLYLPCIIKKIKSLI